MIATISPHLELVNATSDSPRVNFAKFGCSFYRHCRLNLQAASGDTSKPASWGHLKTGQLSASRTAIVLLYR